MCCMHIRLRINFTLCSSEKGEKRRYFPSFSLNIIPSSAPEELYHQPERQSITGNSSLKINIFFSIDLHYSIRLVNNKVRYFSSSSVDSRSRFILEALLDVSNIRDADLGSISSLLPRTADK
ncbi:UNVERIFIED_CONTAM: hypothetical protein PYX00_003581 [Menopon gallinae]|uniref:Uncharacterized protein n=1 Tax=Menopon gallinae TaxID=328185 RepID=A0AAW2I105_9NEOP